MQMLDIEDIDLGTHSYRKGVATIVAAGCIVPPTIVSISVRASWVMGGVKDRLLKRKSTGIQYVGCCATGLDQLNKSFAISPPYFDFSSTEEEIDQDRFRKRIEDWLQVCIIEEDEISASSQHIVWLFLNLYVIIEIIW